MIVLFEALKDEKLAELNENLKIKEQEIETQKERLNAKLAQEKPREVTQTLQLIENKNWGCQLVNITMCSYFAQHNLISQSQTVKKQSLAGEGDMLSSLFFCFLHWAS